MRYYLFLFIFFFIISCTNSKSVYWCGDHPCINKKEKEAYFKKTMIVEIRDLNKGNYKNKSEIEKLLQQTQIDEKKVIKNEKELAKQAKLEEKRRIKNEKELAKQAKLEEKRRIKNEKELAKQAQLEEKRRIKEEKELKKEIKQEEEKLAKVEKRTSKKKISKKRKKPSEEGVELNTNIENVKINLNKFSELVEKITKQNSFRPYPDINDIPH